MAKAIGLTISAEKEQQATRKSREAFGRESFQSGYADTEEKISKRKSLIDEFRQARGIKKLVPGFGLAQERIEAGLANPIMETQELATEGVGKTLTDMIRTSGEGFAGKRLGQFGDVVRRGFPEMKVGNVDIREALSTFVGLGIAVGLESSIIKGATGLLKTGEGARRSLEKTYNIAIKTKRSIGDKIGTLFKEIGDSKKLQPEQIYMSLKKLPKGVARKVFSNPNVYKVKEMSHQGITLKDVPAVDPENIWHLRRALDEIGRAGKWYKDANPKAISRVREVTSELRNMLSKVNPKLSALMDDYSQLSKGLAPITDLVTDKRGGVVVSKLASALKDPLKRIDTIHYMDELGKSFKYAAKMMKNIDVLNRNQALVRAGKRAIDFTVGSAIFSRFMRNRGGSDTIIENNSSV